MKFKKLLNTGFLEKANILVSTLEVKECSRLTFNFVQIQNSV